MGGRGQTASPWRGVAWGRGALPAAPSVDRRARAGALVRFHHEPASAPARPSVRGAGSVHGQTGMSAGGSGWLGARSWLCSLGDRVPLPACRLPRVLRGVACALGPTSSCGGALRPLGTGSGLRTRFRCCSLSERPGHSCRPPAPHRTRSVRPDDQLARRGLAVAGGAGGRGKARCAPGALCT